MFLFNLGKIVCFIIFQTDKCLLPLLYCFQNLFGDVTSDVADEDDVDELYEQSKLVFSKTLLDMFIVRKLCVYWRFLIEVDDISGIVDRAMSAGIQCTTMWTMQFLRILNNIRLVGNIE